MKYYLVYDAEDNKVEIGREFEEGRRQGATVYLGQLQYGNIPEKVAMVEAELLEKNIAIPHALVRAVLALAD